MFPLDKHFVVVFFFSVCIRKLETIVQTCVSWAPDISKKSTLSICLGGMFDTIAAEHSFNCFYCFHNKSFS